MTWLWRIFSSLLCAAPLAAGTVAGTIVLENSRDPGVQKHHDFSGVVVWLESTGGRKPAPAPPRRFEMLQKQKRFTPHVLAVPLGSTVDFPNLDPIFHNAFSNFSGQPFDIGLYPPRQSRSWTFTRSGIVRVFCNIHPTMSAVIAVLETPWFAITRPDGTFAIRDVPSGEYRLRVFHERATADTLRALERTVTVNGAAATPFPPAAISESGYLEAPHKNKYGKDYPPVIEDHATYPGGRK